MWKCSYGIEYDPMSSPISLDATISGRPLYKRMGFTDSTECMILTKDK